jgi:hypothetical protein
VPFELHKKDNRLVNRDALTGSGIIPERHVPAAIASFVLTLDGENPTETKDLIENVLMVDRANSSIARLADMMQDPLAFYMFAPYLFSHTVQRTEQQVRYSTQQQTERILYENRVTREQIKYENETPVSMQMLRLDSEIFRRLCDANTIAAYECYTSNDPDRFENALDALQPNEMRRLVEYVFAGDSNPNLDNMLEKRCPDLIEDVARQHL